MVRRQQRVRGAAYLSARGFIEDCYGADGLARVFETLTADERGTIDRVNDRAEWYPFDTWLRLVGATDSVLGTGDLELVRRGGHWGAVRDLGTMFPDLAINGTPNDLVELASRFWSSYYDGGRAEAVVTDEADTAVFEVIDYPTPHELHCNRVVGWIGGAYEHIGIEVVMTMPRCRARGDDRCLYIASGAGAAIEQP